MGAEGGERLPATVHSYLGHGEPAGSHAEACEELSAQNGAEQTPFDRAWMLEYLALARDCAGSLESAELQARARRAGDELVDEGDKKVFLGLLDAGAW